MPSQLNTERSHNGQMAREAAPLVGVIMGSKSDWDTLRHAADTLKQFNVSHECRVVSAHRTPEVMRDYARTAEERGLCVIIAGAGGAAHLPGMVAAQTTLPVLGVPVQSRTLQGLDSLLSIVQMPAGVPVGTLAIGDAGARTRHCSRSGCSPRGIPSCASVYGRTTSSRPKTCCRKPYHE